MARTTAEKRTKLTYFIGTILTLVAGGAFVATWSAGTIVYSGPQEQMPSLSTTHYSRERLFALVILCIVLVANAVALSAELRVGQVTGNDNVSHLSLLKGMV